MPTYYRSITHCLLLGLIISICYSNSLTVPFQFDDYPNIVHDTNLHLETLTWDNLKNTRQNIGGNPDTVYRPVARLSLALNYYFSGLNTVGYHLTNLAIHCIAACFLYLLFHCLLTNIPRLLPKNIHFPSAADIALLATVLWAIHPVQVQSVTYIVQRMASMATMFYIISFYCYCRFRFNQQLCSRITFAILALGSWILAILSKENAILLPLAILCFELVFFPLTPKRKLFSLFLCLLFILVAAPTFLLMRGDIIEYLSSLYTHRPFSMGERLLTEPRIIFQYIGLLLLPVNSYLSHESDIIVSTNLFSPITTGFSLLLLILLLVFAIWVRNRNKLVSFAILFFFINHLVESSFIGLELYFEHRNYLPSMFLFLAIASLLLQGKAFYALHKRKFMQLLVTGFIVFLLIGEGSTTWLRNEDWRTEQSLLEDAIVKAPENIRPYISLSVHYMRANEFNKAKELLKKAEDLTKRFPGRYQKNHIALLYSNAGALHIKLGNNDKALLLYQKSISLNNERWDAYASLGYIFYLQGETEKAQQCYINALLLNNQDPKLYNMLARVFYKKGEFDNAKTNLEAGRQVKDLPILSLNLMGVALAQNNTQEARRIFYRLPEDKLDPLYLLYKAVLETDTKQEMTAQQLGQFLFKTQVPLCEWLQRVKENNSAGIIFPDIQQVEQFIRQGYTGAIDLISQDIQKQKNTSEKCTDFELEFINTPTTITTVHPVNTPWAIR